MWIIALTFVGSVIVLGFIGSLVSGAGRRARCAVLSEKIGAEACAREHDATVQRIARALRERTATGPVSLRKKAVPHQVPKAGDLRRKDEKIDISDLHRILSIDVEKRLCVAESGVSFVDLVEATLAHGLVPIVVPELKTITIGGAVSGCSIESMSFEHGGFHDTCLEYEVITSGGDVLTCTPENEHALVFQMIHGSFGTLGILAKLTFKLVPAKRFVRMTYEKHADLASYKASIWRHFRERDLDFMDGIIHSPTEYVLSVGHFVDDAPYTTRYDWTRVYYLSTRERTEDYLRTADYFFRYDRGVTNVWPKSLFWRFLIGRFVGSAEILWLAEKLHWLFLSADRPTITLDVFVPFSRVEEFLTWYGSEFAHFPLWCVPYRRVRDYEWIADGLFDGMEDELFLDLAIYGMKQDGEKHYHRLMEMKLQSIGGIKTLIDHNYYTEDEFWKSWNKPNYDRVKAVTDPRNMFRNIYTKTCKTVRGLT